MASLGVAANSPLYGLVVELVKAAGKEDEWESSKQVNRHHFHLRIENEGFMPLVVEAWNIGGSHVISVAHYWMQNGDAMRDPEVVMMNEGRLLTFQQDPYIYQELASYEKGPAGVSWKISPRLYASVLDFTKMWVRNIKAQGFINAARKNRSRVAVEG
jgi:hypothetical protein